MSELLSAQIGAFRKYWRKASAMGVQLQPEAVQMMDALFASFQGQARILEVESVTGAAAAQARLCDEAKAEVEAFVDKLRAKRAAREAARFGGNVVAFPGAGRPSSGPSGHLLPRAGEGNDGGDAA